MESKDISIMRCLCRGEGIAHQIREAAKEPAEEFCARKAQGYFIQTYRRSLLPFCCVVIPKMTTKIFLVKLNAVLLFFLSTTLFTIMLFGPELR
jgi:hypothetical protein